MSEDEDWQPPTEFDMKVFQAKRERSDKISKLMGDYLLKGYKMLGTCCPICDTILLQDKHSVNYCVACKELDSDNVKDDPALSSEAALRQAAEHKQKSAPSSKNPSPTGHEAQSLASASQSVMAASLPSTAAELQHVDSIKTEPRSLPERTEDTLESEQLFSAIGCSQGHTKGQLDRVSPDLTRNTPKSSGRNAFNSQSSGGSDVPIQESTSGGTRPRTLESHRHPPKRSLSHSRNATERYCSEHTSTITQALDILFSKIQKASTELQQSRDVRHCSDLCQLIKGCAEAADALKKLHGSQAIG